MTVIVRFVAVCFLLAHAHAEKHQRRVFSIGDLHGDFDHFKTIVEKLGLAVFSKDGVRWTGGSSILVSTGDTVDRGAHGRPIYIAFQQLAAQAHANGGEVVNIIGNHELMNLQGDYRYVPDAEMSPKGDYGGETERRKEWAQTGVIGADIRKRFHVAALREGTLFVHGGLLPEILRSNDKDGEVGIGPLQALDTKVRELFARDVVPFNHRLFGDTGPFWNRFLAEGPENEACELLDETLRILKAKRMVVGHTPQAEGVNVRCKTADGPRMILGDTVISSAYEESFGFSRPSAVEYDGDQVTALYFPASNQKVQRASIWASMDSKQ